MPHSAGGVIPAWFPYLHRIGFILTYTYTIDTVNLRGTRRGFFAARVARIYPVYVFGLVVAAGPTLWEPEGVAGVMKVSPITIIASTLTLTQAWLPWGHFVWNGPSWSLSAEALFYLVFPFLCPFVSRFSLGKIRGGLVVCALATQVIPLTYLTLHPDGNSIVDVPLWSDIVLFNPMAHLPIFLFGMLLGRLFLLRRFKRPLRNTDALAALVILFTIEALLLSNYGPGLMVRDGLLIPIFGLLIYTLARGHGIIATLLSHPIFLLLGEASYALYILHWPLHAWLIKILGVSEQVADGSALFFWCYLALLIIVSILTLRLIEQPARRIVYNKLKGS